MVPNQAVTVVLSQVDIERRLRTENTDLRKHLEIYEEHIRMLTIHNAAYRNQLERLAGITDLSSHRDS